MSSVGKTAKAVALDEIPVRDATFLDLANLPCGERRAALRAMAERACLALAAAEQDREAAARDLQYLSTLCQMAAVNLSHPTNLS
ncbi:MAG: hypothetical protein AAF677_04500 [Pseudomonadota bacterium]